MTSQMAGFGMTGQSAPPLAQAISTALIPFVNTATISTSDVGTVGAGAGNIAVGITAPQLVVSTALVAVMRSEFIGAGLVGQFAPSLASAISIAFTTHMALGVVLSQHPGVGTGVAVGGFVGLISTQLQQQILAAMSGLSLAGQSASALAGAVANAIVNFLNTIVFTIPIIGPSGASPASSVGTGRVV